MAIFPDVLPSVGNDLITGSGLVDYLTGFYGNDTIRGGAGNDIIVEAIFTWPNSGLTFADGFQVRGGLTYDFGRGNDSIDGGAGLDLLTYDDRRMGMVVDLAQGRVTTGAEVDHFIGIEAVELGNGADLVYANKARFVVDLSGGNDRLVGMAGQSLYIGGDGNDTLDLSGFRTPVKVFLDRFTVQVGVNSAQVQEFEIVLGSLNAANTLRGNDFANTFVGGAGNDILDGRGGNDSIEAGAGIDGVFGGVGNDLLYGGSGNDWLFGGAGLDRLTAGFGDDILNLGAANFSGFGTGEYAYGGDGNDRLNSVGAYSSFLYGGAGNDVFSMDRVAIAYGEDGDDRFYTTWNSFINGGSGFDTLFVGGGQVFNIAYGISVVELIVFTGTEDHAMRFAISNVTQRLSAGNDTVTIDSISHANIIFSGNGADNFTINGTRNTVYTEGGNDRVACLYGATVILDTSEGADYVYSSAQNSIIRTGNGADLLEIYGGLGNSVDTGADDDVIRSHYLEGEVSLGSGQDELRFFGSLFGRVELWTGTGADVLTFLSSYNKGQLTIMDFDVALDRIRIPGIRTLENCASVTEDATGVVLMIGDQPNVDLVVRLEGLHISDLSNSIFAL